MLTAFLVVWVAFVGGLAYWAYRRSMSKYVVVCYDEAYQFRAITSNEDKAINLIALAKHKWGCPKVVMYQRYWFLWYRMVVKK